MEAIKEACGNCDELKCVSNNYYDLLDFLQDYLGSDWDDFKEKYEQKINNQNTQRHER